MYEENSFKTNNDNYVIWVLGLKSNSVVEATTGTTTTTETTTEEPPTEQTYKVVGDDHI